MIKSRYQLIIRDRICTPKPLTDDTLIILNCFYKSPEFLWDGSFAALDAIIDSFQKYFGHFIDWTATVVPV